MKYFGDDSRQESTKEQKNLFSLRISIPPKRTNFYIEFPTVLPLGEAKICKDPLKSKTSELKVVNSKKATNPFHTIKVIKEAYLCSHGKKRNNSHDLL